VAIKQRLLNSCTLAELSPDVQRHAPSSFVARIFDRDRLLLAIWGSDGSAKRASAAHAKSRSEAKKKSRTVISMKNDRNHIFTFEGKA
jgi:hypothetical protein